MAKTADLPWNVNVFKFCKFLQSFYLLVFENNWPINKFIEKICEKTKNDLFEWPDDAEYTFNTLRETFTQISFLNYFNPEFPIRLETDVSDYAFAGILF